MSDKQKNKKILKTLGVVGAISAAAVVAVAVKKLPESRYKNTPEEKNPFEGKKVKFVFDDKDPENADGMKGHLVSEGDLNYQSSFYDKYVKRAMDILISGTGLIVMAPVFAGIAIAIQIDDPGTVLFCQKRVGKNKQYFKLHKFRSMKMSTPKNVPTHMLKNPDEYITRVGKFLRAHSLDELPQVWDIFIGNMSVIGPRPGLWNQDLLTAERDKYDVSKVRPGLSGWAQINGRDELEIPEKARLDGEYVDNQSFAMDAKCFLGSCDKVAKDDAVVEGGTGAMDKNLKSVKSNSSSDAAKYLGKNYLDGVSDKELIGNIGFGQPVQVDKSLKRKVLITGAGSYIGESFMRYAKEHYLDNFDIDIISVHGEKWKQHDFSKYDIVLHVAGIAHRKPTKSIEYEDNIYYSVNTLLPLEIAKKAKKEGVKYFFFVSSLSVYGELKTLEDNKIINRTTVPRPSTFYGKSKLLAEVNLRKISNSDFKVIIFRPPMVYGYKCKGNFTTLLRVVDVIPVLPVYNNLRSMIYIDNLTELISQSMLCNLTGDSVLIPQNSEYVCTCRLLKLIYKIKGKKYFPVPAALAFKIVSITDNSLRTLINKAFGTYIIDNSISSYPNINYQLVNNDLSFERSVND